MSSGLDAYAATSTAVFSTLQLKELDGGWQHSKNILAESDSLYFSLYPSSIDVIDNSSGLSIGTFEVNANDDSLSFSYTSNSSNVSTSVTDYYANKDVTSSSGSSNTSASGSLQAPEYTITAGSVEYDRDVIYLLNYDKDYEYILRYWDLVSGSKPRGEINYVQKMSFRTNIDVEYRYGLGMDWVDLDPKFYNHRGFIETSNNFNLFDSTSYTNQVYLGFELGFQKIVSGATLDIYDTLLQINITYNPVSGYDTVTCVLSEMDFYVQQDIELNTQRTADQQKEYHDQDQTDATSAGQAMSGVATDLQNVKNKWEILWYPIEFTNNLMSAFQGTQAAVYNLNYGNISGYTYNETSGLLEPVYSRVRSGPPGSATITFPEYTLPVLNVKLWDSYSYDMSSLKDQFPALFDALYVFVSMIEVFLFVGFLRKKYEEVFRR